MFEKKKEREREREIATYVEHSWDQVENGGLG